MKTNSKIILLIFILTIAILVFLAKLAVNNSKPVNLIPPSKPIPTGYLDLNDSLKQVSLKTGLSPEQRKVLQEIARDFISEPYGPPEKLVSLGRTVSKFKDSLVDDGLKNHGHLSYVEFEEVQAWSKVVKELNSYKYE